MTELILTLEAVVDALDSDIRPMDVNRDDIFKSTPNLNKDNLCLPATRGQESAALQQLSPLSGNSAGIGSKGSRKGTPTFTENVVSTSPSGHGYGSSYLIFCLCLVIGLTFNAVGIMLRRRPADRFRATIGASPTTFPRRRSRTLQT